MRASRPTRYDTALLRVLYPNLTISRANGEPFLLSCNLSKGSTTIILLLVVTIFITSFGATSSLFSSKLLITVLRLSPNLVLMAMNWLINNAVRQLSIFAIIFFCWSILAANSPRSVCKSLISKCVSLLSRISRIAFVCSKLNS